MQDMQKDKRWIEAQKKYKNDKEKLSQEQMKLYKELGSQSVCQLSADIDPIAYHYRSVPGGDPGTGIHPI